MKNKSCCRYAMNIEELKNIMNLMDLDSILKKSNVGDLDEQAKTALKNLTCLPWRKKALVEKTIAVDDELQNKRYSATFYQNCKAYGKRNFISFFQSKWVDVDGQRIPIPQNSILFTDAPVNEEYERDIRSILPCPTCGKEFIKKELLEYEGEFFLSSMLLSSV